MHVITIHARTLPQAGQTLGARYRTLIARHVGLVARTARKNFDTPWATFVRSVTPLQRTARRQTPQAWAFFAGIVRGSRISRGKLFAANSYDLLDNRQALGRRSEGHCTDVLYRGRGQAWLAHTEDWDPAWRQHLMLLTVRLPSVQFSALTFPGELPGYATGANRFGVAYGCNSLTVRGEGIGLPLPFALFHLNLARSADDALRRFEGLQTGSSVNVNLLDSRQIASSELLFDGRSHHCRTHRGTLAHTNHCLPDGPFTGQDLNSAAALRYSTDRLARAHALLRRRAMNAELAASEILADTVGRHPIYNQRTLARVTYDLAARRMTVYDRGGQVVVLPFG